MASGDTLLVFSASDGLPPSSNFATPDRNDGLFVLDFDDTTNWSVEFYGVMPQNYAGTTGVTVYIHYAMSTGTTGAIDWDAAFQRLHDTAVIGTETYAAVNSVDDTTIPVAANTIDVVNIPFTDGADMDSVTKGDGFRLKITRDAAADDASGDAELVGVEIRET